MKSLSCVRLLATPWTVAYQAPLSVGFSRQEYWSGLPFPPPGELPDPGIEPMSPVSPALQAHSLPTEPSGKSTYASQSGQKKVPKGAPLSPVLTLQVRTWLLQKRETGLRSHRELGAQMQRESRSLNYPTCIPTVQPLSLREGQN